MLWEGERGRAFEGVQRCARTKVGIYAYCVEEEWQRLIPIERHSAAADSIALKGPTCAADTVEPFVCLGP